MEQELKELVGKTIKSVEITGHSLGCDSKNVLVLTTEDGQVFNVVGGYCGYTGDSCDEYVEFIKVRKDLPEICSGNFPG